MKRLFILLSLALILSACGNPESQNTIAPGATFKMHIRNVNVSPITALETVNNPNTFQFVTCFAGVAGMSVNAPAGSSFWATIVSPASMASYVYAPSADVTPRCVDIAVPANKFPSQGQSLEVSVSGVISAFDVAEMYLIVSGDTTVTKYGFPGFEVTFSN